MPADPAIAKAFAARLRALMTARGWTAYRLAKTAGVEPIQVSRLLSGSRLPAWPTALLLADALGCSLDDLR